jgi:hypothetical protein
MIAFRFGNPVPPMIADDSWEVEAPLAGGGVSASNN